MAAAGQRQRRSSCVGLRRGGERAQGATSDAQCGGLTPGTLEMSAGATEGSPHVFGTLPDQAAKLVVAGGGESREAMVADDRRDLPGKFYFLEMPNVPEDQLTVTVEDGSGAIIASEPFLDVVARSSPY